jgi:hypothetical protein
VRLEEAELADLLGGDAAGGEVGDGSGGEFEADVGDVGLAREDGDADGADLFHRRLRERENDVEIVNHQVEHDVYVERSRREDTEAVGLEEHGFVQRSERRGDGWVEALQVTDSNDAVVLLRECKNLVSFAEGGGEGFLDEDVDAGEQEFFCNSCVMDGGHADGCGVDLAKPHLRSEMWGTRICGWILGIEKGVERCEGGDLELGSQGFAALGVEFYEPRECNEIGVRLLEFAVDAKVVTPEGAGADDGDTKRSHGYFFAGVSTASRQRA